MVEPTNAVLSERIATLSKDLHEYKKTTNADIKEIDGKITSTKEIANEVNYSMRYVKLSVDKMDTMMVEFINLVGVQNDKIGVQSDKIDTFISGDKVGSDKRKFIVSILQVLSGIVIAVLGILATKLM